MIGAAVFVGSLGFPVIFVMSVFWRTPRAWDLHTKLTLTMSGALVLVGWALLLGFESGNPRTLAEKGPVATAGEVLFLSVMSRSGGFATMDVEEHVADEPRAAGPPHVRRRRVRLHGRWGSR